ncbi:membrane protein [Nocardioides baekrokdamisoli]|uniref:Membrane protein n=1 Tax=Nocardioides baekrokdamisoli TaxID=1804624 RepID=A0A3G9IG37_9ACTN|nr:DUF4126 domain-containing protein [Nocardioides baekrokdamisoli]BBH17947.1 membrane protein [Nocardioides baekrokdamisoli]
MDALALSFTSGWASGLNSYLVVLVLGIADRIGHVQMIPDVLGSWPVLAVAAFMYAFEFVADKIPYLDSVWDGVSTFIRPAVGAAVGALIAGNAHNIHESLNQGWSALVGGSTALGAHATKAGTRLAANTLPEPFTNLLLSFGEDGLVLAVMALALAHPIIAGSIAGVLLVCGIGILFVVIRAIRRGLGAMQEWMRARAVRGQGI